MYNCGKIYVALKLMMSAREEVKQLKELFLSSLIQTRPPVIDASQSYILLQCMYLLLFLMSMGSKKSGLSGCRLTSTKSW